MWNARAITGPTLFGLILAVAITASAATKAADTEPVPQNDAEFTVREITSALFKAKPGQRLDYSHHDLTYLDLAGLDFKGANLAHSDLYGTDFTGANLKGTDLSHTRLNRSVLIRADLSGADLTGATIFRPTVYDDLSQNLANAPRFSGANMTGVRVMANLSGADFRGANMTGADFSPLESRPGQGTITSLMKNVLKSCDFSGAALKGANFDRADLTFSRFVGADLAGANLEKTDLSKVDFTGADLTGADMTGADLYGATLTGAKGLDTVKGLSTAVNADKATR
jgi:uncharacterized protein YjbI with pentapeptide repeats